MSKYLQKSLSYNNIITRIADEKAISFKTIDEKSLQEISSWMPEVNRAVSSFSKQNSQTTTAMMSLNMIDNGPYRTIRQIMAQVEKKRSALREAFFRRKEAELRIEELEEMMKSESNDIKYKKIELQRAKKMSGLTDSITYIEAALKEIGNLKNRYYEILKNKNIPEKWTEEDFEKAEIEHHIKSIFRNAIKDRLGASCNMGTMEYMEQFGINPIVGYSYVDMYLHNLKNKPYVSIDDQYEFLDQMYEKFKDEYKKTMKRIGIDNIMSSDFLMKESV